MLLLLEAINFYIYAKSHWKCHTFEGYYICSFSKLRHKAHQKVCKCSLKFPLQNGIVTFYENCTNNMLQSIIKWVVTFEWHGLSQQFIPLNVRKWTPTSYLKRQNFIPDAKSVTLKKP